MARRVAKGKGVRFGAPVKARRGLGGHKGKGHSGPTDPHGYRSSMPGKRAKGAEPREENHPGHRMLAAGRRAKHMSAGY